MPSYKSDRGTWYCSFYYTDWQGKRKKKKKEGFKTRREAQDWERKFLEEYAGTPDISFDALLHAYEADDKIKLKPSSYHNKWVLIRTKIAPFFGSTPINKIDKKFVNEYKNNLLQSGFKPSYIKSIYEKLGGIFKYAMENYNLPDNPCTSLGNLREDPHEDYWTIDEFRAVAATLEQPRYIMLFYLLFWTGIRLGEALALTWDDINLESKTIDIHKTKYRIKGQELTQTTKTASSHRTVALPQFLVDMLADYKKLTAFLGDNLFEMSRSAVEKQLARSAQKAGIHRIRVHDLRHSHASMLINADFSPVDIADRLGHANAAVTLKVYSHFYKHKRERLADKINSMT